MVRYTMMFDLEDEVVFLSFLRLKLFMIGIGTTSIEKGVEGASAPPVHVQGSVKINTKLIY